MFQTIKTKADIGNFLDKTNGLHDGYIIGVWYANDGISKINGGYFFDPEQTKLRLKILVTSLHDTIIEIEFENLVEWQIRDNQFEITDTSVILDDQNRIIWSDDIDIDMDQLKKGSFVVANSMKWRMLA